MYIAVGPGFPVMYEQTVCTGYYADIFLALYLTNLDLRKESPVNLYTGLEAFYGRNFGELINFAQSHW